MINCGDNQVPLKSYLNSMVRVAGPLSGLPIVVVTGHTENALKCDNNHLGFEDFLKLSIGVDPDGKPAIRVKYIDSATTVLDCGNNAKDPLLNQVFAYDSTAKTYALVLNKST